VDATVPVEKREVARETVAAILAASLREHPHFADLAVLLSRHPRRGGWQIAVVALDSTLSPLAADPRIDAAVLERARLALARL
jgi:hypothetical protein